MLEPEIRLFSSDLDGTILGNPAAVKRFKQAWEAMLPAERPLLVYNSGRRVEDIMTFIEAKVLPDPDYVIGGVGTEIFNFTKSEWMSDFNLALEAGWDLAQVEEIVGRVPEIESQPPEFLHAYKSSWYLYDATTEQVDALRATLKAAGMQVEVVYSSRQDLDVLPQQANKGNALKWLCAQVGIELDQCVVAGDTGNDSAMFLVDGVYGIVPKNAKPELLHHLVDRHVFAASQEVADGILEGLIHYGVIKGN